MSTAAPAPPPSGWVSSVVALALGVVLSVGVSALFSAFGWGGELASQTAGASSGAAPLLLDGLRHRRARRTLAGAPGGSGPGAVGSRDWPHKLLVASCFAFAVLVLESAWGLFVFHLARWALRAARGDSGRFQAVYTVLGVWFILPVVLGVVYLCALAAGRRLREHRRRWILLGTGVYAVVRVANIVVVMRGPRTDGLTSVTNPLLVVGFLVTVPVIAGVALLGVRRARRTQAAFDASVFFRRLDPADREAALALLHDAQPRRRRGTHRSEDRPEPVPPLDQPVAEPLR